MQKLSSEQIPCVSENNVENLEIVEDNSEILNADGITTNSDSYDVFGKFFLYRILNFLGLYMATQLRLISDRNSNLGLKLKAELINTCLRYEKEC